MAHPMRARFFGSGENMDVEIGNDERHVLRFHLNLSDPEGIRVQAAALQGRMCRNADEVSSLWIRWHARRIGVRV